MHFIFRYIRTVFERWQSGWKEILVASAAGGLAWFVAERLFTQHQPIFAVIAAMASLAPGAQNHGKQAVALLLGVSTGIMLGELALAMPQIPLFMRIMFVTATGLALGAVYGTVPATGMQVAVSALLVMLMGFSVAGTTRLYDVMVGAGIGLLFSQVLLTPDPIRSLDVAARRLIRALGDGLHASATGLTDNDGKRAQAGLGQVVQAHARLNTLETVITNARLAARWSLRGRLAAREVVDMAERYDRRAIRLYATGLLLAEEIANGLNRVDAAPPPPWLASRVTSLAAIAKAGGSEPLEEAQGEASGHWLRVAGYLSDFETALQNFHRTDRASRQLMEEVVEARQADTNTETAGAGN